MKIVWVKAKTTKSSVRNKKIFEKKNIYKSNVFKKFNKNSPGDVQFEISNRHTKFKKNSPGAKLVIGHPSSTTTF
jgi:hypothetical protein